MRGELALYVTWYNENRPHQALDGMAPIDVYRGEASPKPGVRFETRPRWPVTDKIPHAPARRLHLTIKFLEGRRHLPIVELEQAA